ncbi:hypothetical protein L211DRAFT_855408 [Terfezia boudieri ATCC MYA-4762]|uniref:Uncharacterized protein n=1 Tax=Terfezia boudieri ATCC MYA-4762 TaxID=1051890 RepID=A0A3N4LZW1_9PEZI|nr:hypothetical protein L211DRAFT_855408 [Terfezia boudieri ATCC MYA-4762]
MRLLRPLGMDNPPQKGENSGVDTRTPQQKRDDFVNWDKHLEKRKRLSSQFGTSYFKDFNTMTKEHKGKTWIAPSKLFRARKSLYFPNLQGRTLVPPRRAIRDTTDILITPSPGVISVVAVFSSMWGQNQVATFMDDVAVAHVIEENKGKVQRVDVNIEENTLKAMLITLFVPSLRKRIPKDRHDKYFIVRQGVTDEIRSQVGLVNGRVGYVYLVDSQGRIRWAASGVATDEEKEALVKGVRRLVELDLWTKDSSPVASAIA